MSTARLEAVRNPAPAAEELARADLYALLAGLLYAAPGRELLDTVARTALMSEEPEGELRTAWQALQEACAAADPEAVRGEFDHLFVGVGYPLVKPYASFFIAGYLNEKPLVDLRDELARLGFGRRTAVGETEDHLSALADVMRMMILGVGGSSAADLGTQRRFFQRFIQPWYARFAEELARAEGASFYAVVGRFAKAFLDVESASFEIA